MPFPFLFLAVALVLGIWLSTVLSLSFLVGFILLVSFLCLAWFFFSLKKNLLSFISILLSTILLGLCLHVFHQSQFENNALHRFEYDDYADFYGRLLRSPSRGKDSDFLFLRVEKVVFGNTARMLRGNLRVSVPHSSEFHEPLALYTGDRVKVSAGLLSSPGFRNFNVPSFSSFLMRDKIHQRATTKSPLLVEKIKKGKNISPFHSLSLIRRKLQEKIEEYFPSRAPQNIAPEGAVLEALLLGERNRIPPATSTTLQKSGLYHLFAISGAHIAIISFLIFSMFKLLKFPSRLSYILLMGFLLIYAFLVEGRPSVMRATVMACAFLLGKLLWKDVNLLNTISAAAFFLLVVNPLSLFDLGFQLTFAATYSIILFFPRLIKFFPKLPLRLSEILVLSITAQLGVLPFIAAAFNRVTFSSLLLNYAALPLVGIIMALGYILLPLSFLSPFLAQPLARAVFFLITVFEKSTHLFDRVSFLSYRIPTPHPALIAGYFLVLLLLLLPVRVKQLRIPLFLSFFALLAILITHPFPSYSRNLKCTFIDVGQGDSVLVEFPGQKKMLIDGGGIPESNFDVGERVVSPFLWRKGIKKIHYLVLTHAHPDHLNGLLAIARNFKVAEYWDASSPLENSGYQELKKSLPPTIPQKRVSREYALQQSGVQIDVIHPEEIIAAEETVDNNNSLVLRITYGRTTFLLTADIEEQAEREVLESGMDIKSQVIKSAHHGSSSSSTQDFLERVAPQVVVISVGAGNRYGFPNQDVLERYERAGARIFRTDLHGGVEVSSDGRNLSVRTAVNEPERH